MNFQTGQILKFAHESGNEYIGEVIERGGKLFARTLFMNWHIELDDKIQNPRYSWFKSIEVVGKMPEDSFMLELPAETLLLLRQMREGKFSDKAWTEEWKKQNR